MPTIEMIVRLVIGVVGLYLVMWHLMTAYPYRKGPIKDLKRLFK